MWVPSYETPEGWAALENMTGLTYEALVNINEFAVNRSVTSLMGIEEHALIRIGDSGYPRRQIQFKTGPVAFPYSQNKPMASIQLKANEWYHIAVAWSFSEAMCRIYVNGRLAYEAPMSWSEDTFDLNRLTTGGETDEGRRFFIGYSYNPDRPLNGMVSEVRIWSVARSREDIFRDMYEVKDPATKPELRAYWRFDEGMGNVVKDRSQYGNDAYCLTGTNNFENDQRIEGTLKWNAVDIPKFNTTE
jgi:hypothetical protein